MTYNAAFFGLFENTFKLLKKEFGLEKALAIFTQLMEIGLGKAYGDNFIKGQPKEFARIVSERDKMVGLHVEFPLVDEYTIIYQFHDDPFPNLRGEVDEKRLDKSYLDFKINHILGSCWHYHTPKHLWRADSYTEHVITKHNSHIW